MRPLSSDDPQQLPSEVAGHLVREAWLSPDCEDAVSTASALDSLLTLAASLCELDLDGVPPALGHPRWD